jgi:membrane protein insertase Oxa1/YidC/SpoIIIJ
MKTLRRTHGVYPSISALNILQLPVHMIMISMINRISYNIDINPAILTDGILWFKDLSSPDPYGILPIASGII